MVDEDRAPGGPLLHRDEWLRRGIHARQLASDRFIRVFPGFHTPADSPASLIERCRLLQRTIAPGAVVSHWSAAALLRMALPPSQDVEHPSGGPLPQLHVVRARSRARIATGYRVHAGGVQRAVEVDGVAVCHPYEVLCQLAPSLLPWDLTIAIESIVRPGFEVPDLTIDGVEAHATLCASGAVARLIGAAARRARSGAASPEETILRLLLAAAGFPEPRHELVVEGAVGSPAHGIAWAWPSARVGIDPGALGRGAPPSPTPEHRTTDLLLIGWWELRPARAELEAPLLLLLQLRCLLERGDDPVPPLARVRTAVTSLGRRTAHLSSRRAGT